MISFVILHYLNILDTKECVDSIRDNISEPEVQIVLVDNGSPDGSGSQLFNEYKDVLNIHFIFLEKNLGFASGNNEGYQYARNKLKSRFIFVINNDTIVRGADFVSLVIEKYNIQPFDIMGPDILSLKDESHQNPRKEILTDEQTINGFIRRFRIMHFLSTFDMDLRFLQLKKAFFPASALINNNEPKPDFHSEARDVKLHGSALIFSPSFVERYNRCFYPGTFMYNEESILNFIAVKEQLKTIYFPSVQILHKEDGATDSFLKSVRKKRKFYYKHFIRSSKVLLKLHRYGFNVQDMQ